MKAAVVLLASAMALVFAACSSENSSTCDCSVEVNGDKRELTCGQSACVGGFNFSCGETGATKGSACKGTTSSSSTSSSSSSSSSTTSSTSGSAGDACSDLATYCSTKCKAPAAVNKSCTDAVADGNGSKCVAWQASNASLCKLN